MNDGFADLKTARDLLRKMEHDRARMSQDPMDTYAAFDFFVTAEHMLDWLIPDEPGKSRRRERQDRRDGNRLLRITSHLANGAKHFRVTAAQHESVEQADTIEGAFDPRAFSTSAFSPSAFAFSGLHVQLDDGELLHAYSLADQVLELWRSELRAESGVDEVGA